MRSLRWAQVGLLLSLADYAVAQTTADPLDALFSDAVSLFTFATSVLAPAFTQATSAIDSVLQSAQSAGSATATSAPTTATSSATSGTTSSPSSLITTTSSSPATSTSSSSGSSKSATTSWASRPTAALKGAASDTTPTPSSSDGGGKNNNLAIILGSVFGAIILIVLIAFLVFCLRRRRRRRDVQHIYSSPDESVENWHDPGLLGSHRSSAGPDHSMFARNLPETAEHDHRTPFLPAAAAATTMHNSPHHRDVVDGPAGYGTYDTNRNSITPPSPRGSGIGVAPVGVFTRTHHNHNPSNGGNGAFGAAEHGDLRRHTISRKPVGSPIMPSRSPRRSRHSGGSDDWGSPERYSGYESIGSAY